MTRRIALCLMAIGWFVGFTIAAIPVIWNKWEVALECEFDQIFYPWYMVGVITPVFSLVWLCMLFVYCRIWREASKQVKQLRTTGQQEGTSDWKSVQVSWSCSCIISLHMEIASPGPRFRPLSRASKGKENLPLRSRIYSKASCIILKSFRSLLWNSLLEHKHKQLDGATCITKF